MSSFVEGIRPAKAVPLDDASLRMVTSAILLFLITLYGLYTRNRMPKLPPGPRQLPIIGNLHSAPPRNMWVTYQKWHKQYGPIISLKYGQRLLIVLGTHQAARDLLQKRSNIYSSRPRFVVDDDCKSKGLIMGLMPYGVQWKQHHRLVSSLLNAVMAHNYQYAQDIESKQLLSDMLHVTPDNFSIAFHRYTASLVFNLAYGERIHSMDDKRLGEVDQTLEDLSDSVSGVNSLLVEMFPILNWLPEPLAPWRRKGRDAHNKTLAFFEGYFTRAQNSKSWNWAKEAVKLNDSNGKTMSFTEIVYTIGLLYEASTTTNKASDFFVMACALYPETVVRAHEELDRVVGRDRLPNFEDMVNLPYVTAFLNEVLRWRPIAPMGIPHANMADDSYLGYYIPKGTTILPNLWSLSLEDDVFKDDPLAFKPERWLTEPNLPVTAFGFGKRLCPGQHLGRRSMIMIIARLLWGFDITHANDQNGKKIEIDPWNMEQGMPSGPNPFKASIRVRSPQHKRVIENEWANADKDDDKIMNHIEALVANSTRPVPDAM